MYRILCKKAKQSEGTPFRKNVNISENPRQAGPEPALSAEASKVKLKTARLPISGGISKMKLKALAVCLASTLLPALLASEPCLRVDQKVTEMPGLEEGEVIKQRLWIGKNKLRLDQGSPRGDFWVPKYVVRVDTEPAPVYELFPKTQTYRKWEDELQNLQQDRNLNEAQIIAKSRELPSERRKRILASQHIRADGKRIVNVNIEEGRSVTLKEKAYQCKHLVVEENGLKVVDALITGELVHGQDYYRFYRHLGTFSKQVLSKLKEIEGFPLKARLAVVTHRIKPYHTVEIEVTGIARTEKSAQFFEVPDAWQLDKKALKVPCSWRKCNNIVETSNPGARFDYKRRHYYFCSRECKMKFIESLKNALESGEDIEHLLK